MSDLVLDPYAPTRKKAGSFRQMKDARTGAPAVDEYRPNGGERLFALRKDDKGDAFYEINSSSKKDLMQRIAAMHKAVHSGEITSKPSYEEAQRRFGDFKAAYDDRSDDTKFRVIGEVN